MGVPIEKRLGNVQKALLTRILDGGKSFDPNNPEDVKKQKEIAKQVEAMQSISSLVTDPTGGGLVGMTRGISKAALANMSKSKFAQNKATQFLDFVKKPMTKGKKTVTKKATPTVKEVEEKPVEVIKETLSRLLKPVPKLNKSKSFTTAKAKNALDEIPKDKPSIKTTPTKSDDVIPKINRKSSYSPEKPNSIGTSQTSKVIPEVIPNTIPKATEFTGRPTFGPYSSRANILSEVIPFQKDVYKNLRAKQAAEKAKEIAKEIPKEKLDIFSKSVLGTAGLGIASGIAYQGYKGYQGLTSKPTDLSKVNENDLRDSKVYKDVKILKTAYGDRGIIKDPTTGKWKYFDKNKGVKLPEGRVGLGDGPPIGLNDKNNTGDSGKSSGVSTKPRSTTGQAFDKAFAEARKQAGGAAGIFEWNGKKYGTALKGETVPKDRVEVGKKEEYPTFKSDPSLEKFRQDDDNRQIAIAEAQKKEMEAKTTKPLSSLVFKPQNELKGNTTKELISMYDEEKAMDAENRYNAAKNNMPKKKYGGKLAMLKYMK
jgi:hypothetical protein